ncbi:helicase SNF [Brevibacillus fluminis]|uniref:Helicase SNF n=1 Tax=Brevibacillus fluminis TaxID=511487 RepID=A0A3M8DZB0_9BACL|nr:DEAD/DEAH box helicase [Brevibacillus fluminis]RNB92317.1 helicase SNF [Brevibacillus fluminis]
MGFQLTSRIIMQLCGRLAYDRGEAYNRAKKVIFSTYDADASLYEATVRGTSNYQVNIQLDQTGVEAECTCSSFGSSDYYCKHIAAVLLTIRDTQSGKTPIRSFASMLHPDSQPLADEGYLQPRSTNSRTTGIQAADRQLTNRILDLFHEKPVRASVARPLFDPRAVLDLEFTLKVATIGFGQRRSLFGIELKLGPKRLYVVQKIREFLDHVARGATYFFSKNFTYDPTAHCFQRENDAVIQALIGLFQNEQVYRESIAMYSSYTRNDNERRMLISPASWDALFPLLTQAPNVKLVQEEAVYDGLQLTTDPLPLHFDFDQSSQSSYRLDIQGLETITVLEPYNIVLCNGKVTKLAPEPCRRLAEIKQTLHSPGKQHLLIAQEQMEPFMVKVVPGLLSLGSVHVAQAVSDRIEQTPLSAKLYLDRIRDRLLAGLEFHYGDIKINPLAASSQKSGAERILIRDGEKEQRILELMDQSNFTKTEEGYYLEDEEAEYDFLYYRLPELKKLLTVFATTAVKLRMHPGNTVPKVTVDVNERTNWLELGFELDGIPEKEIRLVIRSLEEKRRYYRMADGSLLPLESAEFGEISQLMSDMGVTAIDLKTAGIHIPVVRGLHLLDRERQGNSVKLGKSFRRLLENMRNPDNLDFRVPVELDGVLRDYQKYGFQWMKTLAHYQFGGILADDMGLGKTLQSIAFIVSILPEIREREEPVLIVAPASLVYNWQNELKRFAPQIRSVIADGTKAERTRLIKAYADADVVITSYPLLRRDVEQYAARSFHTLFLDEAQVFKNHATQTAHAVKELVARHRFALTGTPVENRLEELWSIYDAVFPELFDNRKAFHNLTRDAVAKRIRPFLLRRLKTDVLKELPDKIETLQASALLPDQKKLYAAYLAKLQQETLKHLNEDGFQKSRIRILAGLTRLRQLCCHPALFVEDYTGSSAKFEQLFEIIEECRAAGKRLLIFSQFTDMLRMIGRELGFQGVPFFYLDGQTPGAERVELCRRYNEGERELFLISLKAGGTGLNLTGADTVILYDLWWNPAVEQQAADRAHRIGQKNVVQIIRLVTQGTVEDKMFELQQKKKNLIEEVIKPGQEELSALTEEDIREILMIG